MSEHKYLTDEQIGDFYLSCPRAVGPLHSDILALRAELKAAWEERDIAKRAATEYMTWLGEKTRRCLDTDEENARLRKALEEIDRYIGSLHLVPEVMWNDAICRISETVFLALNPQPAQPEKP